MKYVERAIAILSGLITIGLFIWATWSQHIPFWLYVPSIVAAILGGLFLGRVFRLKKRAPALRRIGNLAFDYLPASSPKQKGWHIEVEVENGKPPTFSVESDGPKPIALHIEHTDSYYMDYGVDQSLSLSNLAEFFIRFAKASAFYLRVMISTRDGSQRREVWLRFVPDPAAPKKVNENEWSIPITGDVMNNGWIDARISIADDVARTYGTEGWLYAGLRRIRLRGTLSLSSICFSRIELPYNEAGTIR